MDEYYKDSDRLLNVHNLMYREWQSDRRSQVRTMAKGQGLNDAFYKDKRANND